MRAREFFIESLCENLKINAQNPITIGAINDITKIIEQNEFTSFVAYLGKVKSDFKKPIEILSIAAKEFTEQKQQKSFSNIEEEIKKLIRKCRDVSCAAYDNKPKGLNFDNFATNIATFENFKLNGKLLFTPGEMILLEAVGGCKRWLIDYDCHKFYLDLFNAKTKAMIHHKTSPAITGPGVRTMKLLGA